ncbi:efflux RND transporter permease subunit [Massilia sp. W12]|uniref:efflux RND transporter permease subunit n=1 Tax=Massilia sp. W12 TaxID=3126507 RepID=UPI0030D0C7AB
MWITKTSINNPVFATMVMIGIMVLGLFAYKRLPVEAMPNVQLPFASIMVNYPGASPEQVEQDLTKPIEEVVNTVAGVRKIRSNSWEGRSGVFIQFDLNANMDKAVQEIRDKVAAIKPGFPKDVKDPFIGRGDGENNSYLGHLNLTSDKRDLRELSNLAEQLITKRLQNVPGLGEVRVGGVSTREIAIQLNPDQLSAFGVGVDEVMRALQVYNQNMPAGAMSFGQREQLVRIEGRIKSVAEFNKIIVARRANGPVLLEQVAKVIDGERERISMARINGKPSISFDLIKMQDANVTEVGKGVYKAVQDMVKLELPPDVKLEVSFMVSDYVQKQVDNVKRMIIEGGLLTILIVFLFLHSWRSTVITALTLPISVIASFVALKVFGFTINTLTLMALSLSIGLLIDDAIVVRENIVRHLGMGKSHRQAANDGTNEIGLAVMATTFAIVAVFVPVAFMDGIIGRFFLQFGITVAVAVMISLFVSFTLDPMLSAVWPDPAENRFKYVPWLGRMMQAIEHRIDALHRLYGRVLAWALGHRKTTLGLSFAIFVGSLMLVPLVGGEMFPESDEGEISLNFKMPVGSSLEYSNAKALQIEEALQKFPEVVSVSTVVGDDSKNNVTMRLKLQDKEKVKRRSQKDIEKAIRQRMQNIGGIEFSVGGNDKPIFIAILGQNEAGLEATAQKLMARLRQIKGVVDMEYSQAGANPATVIKINNEVASDLGLTPQQIGETVRPLVAGSAVTRWLAPDGQNYDVNVQLPKEARQKISDLENLMIATGRVDEQGKPVMAPLRQVVQFVPSSSPQVIKRQALMRRVAIYANVEGRPSGDVNKEIDKVLEEIKKELPNGVRFDIGGQAEEQANMLSSFATALGIAVIFIYLVLASQFGSFLQPVAIMMSLPLSLIGVLLALLVTGSTLNMFSLIGFIMLMGLVTKNAILLVDFANQAQREGKERMQALLEAGQVRLRPILMTTLAMVFGMLPMAIGSGDGGEIQAPMGRAVIGGVLTSTLLTLIVVPVAYTYLDSLGKRALRFWHGKDGAAHGAAAPHVLADKNHE